MTPEEFEKIFGNTPFENIQKIKEYINIHFVPYEQYVSNINEINKKWEDKIKAKTIEIKNRPVKDEFITASQGKLNAIIDMESLLEKE